MFEWEWIKKIIVDERVANKAVDLCREYGMHPSDAVHAASAILWKDKGIEALQHWDRDFDKIKHLIKVEEPKYLTKQLELYAEKKDQEQEHASEERTKEPTKEKQISESLRKDDETQETEKQQSDPK